MNVKIAVVCLVLFALYYTAGCNGIVYPRKPLTGVNDPLSPQDEAKEHVLMAKLGRAYSLDHDASIALENEQYAKAEALERSSLSLGGGMQSTEILAQSLEAQGKYEAAIEIYGSYRDWKGHVVESVLLRYALLLLKTNKWPEAVAAYNKKMQPLSKKDLERIKLGLNNSDYMLRANSHFSPKLRQPKALASAIHIGFGIRGIDRWTLPQNAPTYDKADAKTRAQYELNGYKAELYKLNQFSQAVRISPDSELARKYYDNYLNYLKQCSIYNPKVKHATGPSSKDLIKSLGPLKGYGTSL